ncbi:MAG: hypothetical protein EAZ95_03980 [Bacteroidetes bacterium]|nr:MAG: hypothetical protein EAZ95_03980 [Bacteroidota bacterium]
MHSRQAKIRTFFSNIAEKDWVEVQRYAFLLYAPIAILLNLLLFCIAKVIDVLKTRLYFNFFQTFYVVLQYAKE